MKKIIFSATILAFTMVSCNHKGKEDETNFKVKQKDTTYNDSNSTTEHHNEDHAALYSCPMHPEIKGGMNEKCSKCGMELTVVPVKSIE